jgi:hypothetical protein
VIEHRLLVTFDFPRALCVLRAKARRTGVQHLPLLTI